MDIGKLELFEGHKIFVRTFADVLHGYTKARVIRTAQNDRWYNLLPIFCTNIQAMLMGGEYF